MLIKQNRIATYICPTCRLTTFSNISLFDFSGRKNINIGCKCHGQQVLISTCNHKKYKISIPCTYCEARHDFFVGFNDMWLNPIKIIKCIESRMEILFLGEDKKVLNYLDSLDRKKDDIARALGFEKYYVNPNVMLEALNIIHDFVATNKIICECGCSDILINTSKNMISLSCIKCCSTKNIKIDSNMDLKEITQESQIMLCKN